MLHHLPAALVCLATITVPTSPDVTGQSRPPVSEKDARTPAQRKINSQVLYEIYRRQGLAARKQIPDGPTGVRIDSKGRALVDVRAEVTPALRRRLTALGATLVSTSQPDRSTIAWIPLLKIERLAADRSVVAIEPKAEAAIRRPEEHKL